MNNIQRIYQRGQSVWCDSLGRKLIESGELQQLIDRGICGVTSNPTIFNKAIAGSNDYDQRLQGFVARGADTPTIYEKLVLADIADAADILRPVYDRTDGVDGFVSLEVSPKLAHDTRGTIDEAKHLFAALHRPNVFIKVPATKEGIPAIETLIAEGISINVTLIFSREMHERVMHAYIAGLRRRYERGEDVSRVASVASFFVSRVDTLIDGKLEKLRAQGKAVDHLLGQAGIANARLAYARFTEVFSPSGPFGELAAQGARVQRPLWASTSTKNPDYPDTLYCDGLIAPNTVNTMPPETIQAVLDHGASDETVLDDVDTARQLFEELTELGIHMGDVTDQLLVEGVKSFAKSFDDLLANLERKREALGAAVAKR